MPKMFLHAVVIGVVLAAAVAGPVSASGIEDVPTRADLVEAEIATELAESAATGCTQEYVGALEQTPGPGEGAIICEGKFCEDALGVNFTELARPAGHVFDATLTYVDCVV